MKKTVILSSNWNPDYLEYLPYCQAAWNKLGWDTLTFYLGSKELNFVNNEMNAVAYLAQNESAYKLQIPKCVDFAGDYREATAVQVIRLLAAHYIQDGMIMLGDVDMIPLANYWHPTVDHITVYGHDLTGYSQYPMCYIAMTAERWREIIPEKSLEELLGKYPNAKSDDFYKWWGVDQEIITERINQLKRTDELVLVDRGFSNGLAQGRIDRADWERTINSPDRKIDAHMLRPFNFQETERVMKLMQP